MEKIGIFGGTFDPPHSGHIEAAKYAMQVLHLDKIIWLPCSCSPGKTEALPASTPEQRLEMTRLALAGLQRMEAQDWDIVRGGETYTDETISAARSHYPTGEFFLLIGSDIFCTTHRWRNIEIICNQITFVVFHRGMPKEKENIALQIQKLQCYEAKVIVLENPVNLISSTQLRRLVAFDAARDYLTDEVNDYILKRGLYDSVKNWKNLTMEALEPIVVRLLNPNRVKHVLGVRDTAEKMAIHWGVDPTDAARAGLLHDITKALDGPLQLTLCDAYGKILSDFSRRYPKTLHALTGSLVAERIFGENKAVVDAICCHTTGKAAMSDLEKIIYIADYMEPNRDFPGVEKLRELAFTDLTAALQLGLEMTLEHLHNQGSEVSPESREALEYLNH